MLAWVVLLGWGTQEPVQLINEVLMAPQPNPCAVPDRIPCVPGSL